MVIPVKPLWCHRCQQMLRGDNPQPHRHQVTEIPSVKPLVTEYQLHRLVCPECGEAAFLNIEGCRKCAACAYSEC